MYIYTAQKDLTDDIYMHTNDHNITSAISGELPAKY